MFPNADEFGIPIKKKRSTELVDEFGIPVKKKVGDTVSVDGSDGGTVGTSNPQLKSTENFTENFLDPAFEINKKKKDNSIITNSQVLGKVEIPDDAIPANIIDKKGYRTSLQQRLNSKTPEQIDLQVIATTTNKPVEAVEAYAQGRDGKGIMIEFDTVKKTKATELDNLVKKANSDLGLSDTFDGVFATPETASLYIDKIQNAYNQKTEREFNSLNEVVINGKKRTLEQDDEGYVDKSLIATQQQYYNPIKNRNDKVLNTLKATIGEDIIQKVETEVANGNLTYDAGVKKIGDLVFKNELKNITEAKEQRRIKDASGRNELGKLFRDEDEENKNLNSVNAAVESRLNNSIRQNIIYKQAALSDIVQLATEKANAGTLTEEEKVTYQQMVTQLKDDIASKQKDYKSPQVLQKEYPILLKQSVIADINNFNAIQSGNVKGYEESGYKGITLKEHLKAQGYDMNSQVVKDAIDDAESGVGVKDYSFFGEPIKAIKEVFTSSVKSLGDIVGVRDDVTALSEKKAAELFPTTVGANDELQLTTAASTAQNIANTTGQVIGQGLMQTATAGLGRLAGLSKVAASGAGFWSSGTLTSYDQAYKDAFDLPIESGLGRTTYAGLIALANGASEKIFPESKLFNIQGVKGAYSELASKMGTEGFTDKLATQLLTKAKNEFLDYGKKYATNIGKETLEETATSLFESGSRMLFGDPNMNVGKAIEDAKNTAIQTAIGTVLIGGMGVHKDVQQERNIAPSSVIYNAAVYKDEAMDALMIGFKQGNYDQQELNSKISLLNTAEVGLSELKKAEQVIGRELTRPQKELFVANSTAQKLLIEQKKGVEDEAVIKKIDEKLKNLNSQQTQLLDNKVQIDEFGNVVEPVAEVAPETTTEETTDEKITTDATAEAIDLLNAARETGKLGVFQNMEDEAALKMIAQQAQNLDDKGNPYEGEDAAEMATMALNSTVNQFGEGLTNAAIELYPAKPVETTQPEVKPEEVKQPTNKKERLAAFKKNYVEPVQTEAEVKKQWGELSMQEKLALAKENLPEVDNLSNVEAIKVADQNAKMLLAKLNQQPEVATTEVVPPPTEQQSGKDGVVDNIKINKNETEKNGIKNEEIVNIDGEKDMDKRIGNTQNGTKSIIGNDVDLKGNSKPAWMYDIAEYDVKNRDKWEGIFNEARYISNKIMGWSGTDGLYEKYLNSIGIKAKDGVYENTEIKDLDAYMKFLLKNKADFFSQKDYDTVKEYEKLHSEGKFLPSSKLSISIALADGKYEKAVKEGAMTANDAKKIIESAELEVPKEILELATKEQSLSTPKAEPLTSNVVEGSGKGGEVAEPKTEAITKLEKERDAEIEKVSKPDLKLEL
ncbi:MAG TPA: hypothetical protein PLX17_05855, partial [Chitinophagaceae bacterium]|nr:hypothetical protein [Chitinophagaceae bacterium]